MCTSLTFIGFSEDIMPMSVLHTKDLYNFTMLTKFFKCEGYIYYFKYFVRVFTAAVNCLEVFTSSLLTTLLLLDMVFRFV